MCMDKYSIKFKTQQLTITCKKTLELFFHRLACYPSQKKLRVNRRDGIK